MSESVFQGFGRFSRPDIGLISDGFYNLAEIFETDKRESLRNIQIEPETLDSIYGISEVISREDLRSASGLEKTLLSSLNQLNEVYFENIVDSLYIKRDFYTPYDTLGPGGSPFIKSNSAILFNGSIQCESVVYKENYINPEGSIFGPPLVREVPLSTSRASLFSSELGTGDNLGYFDSVKFPGSIRVRRRSHLNRVFVPKTNFLKKSDILENPTHSITLPLNNNGQQSNLEVLATKNTPLTFYCRVGIGTINLRFTEPINLASDVFFYGVQIQPAQQRPNSPPVEFLPVEVRKPGKDDEGKREFSVEIDIRGTGYQNLYDLYVHLYVNPEKVRGIEFLSIDLREFPDRKDLGLIGFNNLEYLKISQGSLTILPLWLKTLKTKLRVLDLSESGDTWRSGPMAWFDIRNPLASTSNITGVNSIANRVPLYTVTSYLTIPKSGPFLDSTGLDWSNADFEEYLKNSPGRSPTQYRSFTAIDEIKLGDRFYGRSPRFDDVFPNLRVLNWSANTSDQNRIYRFLFNNLPKINNNGKLLGYNILGSGASGSILDVGTTSDVVVEGQYNYSQIGSSITVEYISNHGLETGDIIYLEFEPDSPQLSGKNFYTIISKSTSNFVVKSYSYSTLNRVYGVVNLSSRGHISQYKFSTFIVGGRHSQDHDITGFINDPSEDWSEWRNNTSYIDVNRTKVKIDLQTGKWSSLTNLDSQFSGGAVFLNTTSSETLPLKAPVLQNLSIFGSSTVGPMASLGGPSDTSKLTTINIGGCQSIGTIQDGDIEYLLPSNFAQERTAGNEHKLNSFYVHSLNKSFRFREKDFINTKELRTFWSVSSGATGVFPIIPSEYAARFGIETTIRIFSSNFYDLKNLSISQENSSFSENLNTIQAWNMNSTGKGAILPDFQGYSRANRIQFVTISDSLNSRYPSDWIVSSKRWSCVNNEDDPTFVDGLSLQTLSPSSSSNERDKIHKLVGGSDMHRKVMVNDKVVFVDGVTGAKTELATVLSVYSTEVIIDKPVQVNGTLYFYRNTVDISNWFSSGFSSIKVFRARNCRLSGTFSILSGFGQVVDDSSPCLDFSLNCLTGYKSGTLSKIFDTTRVRKITVDLSLNNLSIDSLRQIVEEVYSIDLLNRFRGCQIRLSRNKLSSAGIYTDNIQQEIFPVETKEGPDIVVSLSRQEIFDIYDEIEVIDQEGNPSTTYVKNSTSSITVPGQYVTDSYYLKKVSTTQVTQESSLAVKFKNLRGIKIDFGFVGGYISPGSTQTVTSVSYTEETTREGSITLSGLEPLDSCFDGSNYCWRNSNNQILILTN